VKRILLVMLIITLVATTACSSALSQGDKTSNSAYSFLIYSTQIIDKIGEDIAPEDEAYLVIKYEVENLQDQNDSTQQWSDQIKLEAGKDSYAPIFLDALDNQLWETQLLAHEKKVGYMAFIVPDMTFDFTLTFTFPTSETEAVYELRAIDKRVGVSVDWVFTKLGKIENTRRIPLVGRLLAFSNPIMYQGIILVPKADISQLLEQTNSLSDEAKKTTIEDYLIAHGHCRLE
jgi:hypothetical protein